MAKPRLTSTERLAVVEWLAEGLTDQEIVDKLESNFGKVCTPQNINGNYRQRRTAEIEAAKTARFHRACARGYGNRAARIEVLNEVAERIIEHIRSYPVALTFEGGNCIKEFRDTLDAIRKECGQEAPTKLEHSGPGGGPLEVAVGTVSMDELMADDEGRALLSRIATRLCPRNGDAAHAGDEAD